MTTVKARLNEDGRLLIPAALRRALGIEPGDSLLLTLEDDTLRVASVKRGLRRAQALVRRHVADGTSLADALIEQRRNESRRG
jgi:AbrB family looped-hinge helix DNA binding protein